MSTIFQPGGPNPLYQDFLYNVLTRQYINLTDSTTSGLNALLSFNMVQGLFDAVGKQVCLEFTGTATGALGTKRIAVQIGGGSIPFLYDSGAITANNSNFFGQITMVKETPTQFLAYADVVWTPVGGLVSTVRHTPMAILTASSPLTDLRPISFFDQLGNAGDSITLYTFCAGVL